MICEKCKQREAAVRILEIRNGARTERNLCPQCAKELDLGHHSGLLDSEYPIGKLLADLFGVELGEKPEEIEGSRVICPTCQTTYSDFLKDSRFGCPDCYRVFDLLMEDNVRTIQGSSQHRGKHPKNSSGQKAKKLQEKAAEGAGSDDNDLQRDINASGKEFPEETFEEQLEILQAKLQEALEEEAYEKAVLYRDQIRSLKKTAEASEENSRKDPSKEASHAGA